MCAMNSISNIIQREVNYHDKIIIKCLGPPRPDLAIIQCDVKKNIPFRRKFHRSMYEIATWLCGCDERNAFFCFKCILTNPLQTDAAWTRNGVRDLKHFYEKVKKHGQSLTHMRNEQEFAGLGQPRPVTKPESMLKIVKGNIMGQNIRVITPSMGQSFGEQLLKESLEESDIKSEIDVDNVFDEFSVENDDPLEDMPSSQNNSNLDSHLKSDGNEEDSQLGAAFRKLMETHAQYAGSSGAPLFSVTPASKDNLSVFGEYVSGKMRQYDRRTQILTENAINEILFKADMGFYSVEDNTENP